LVSWAEATEKESGKNRLTVKITAFIGSSFSDPSSKIVVSPDSYFPRAYLITLSALASTFGGIVRPICFAVFEVDDEFKLCWLFQLGALPHFVNKDSGALTLSPLV
jgi:hypothetical protein